MKKNRKVSFILAMILSICMVFTMTPCVAFGTAETEQDKAESTVEQIDQQQQEQKETAEPIVEEKVEEAAEEQENNSIDESKILGKDDSQFKTQETDISFDIYESVYGQKLLVGGSYYIDKEYEGQYCICDTEPSDEYNDWKYCTIAIDSVEVDESSKEYLEIHEETDGWIVKGKKETNEIWDASVSINCHVKGENKLSGLTNMTFNVVNSYYQINVAHGNDGYYYSGEDGSNYLIKGLSADFKPELILYDTDHKDGSPVKNVSWDYDTYGNINVNKENDKVTLSGLDGYIEVIASFGEGGENTVEEEFDFYEPYVWLSDGDGSLFDDEGEGLISDFGLYTDVDTDVFAQFTGDVVEAYEEQPKITFESNNSKVKVTTDESGESGEKIWDVRITKDDVKSLAGELITLTSSYSLSGKSSIISYKINIKNPYYDNELIGDGELLTNDYYYFGEEYRTYYYCSNDPYGEEEKTIDVNNVTSSNSRVIKVDKEEQYGTLWKVTGIKEGTATITLIGTNPEGKNVTIAQNVKVVDKSYSMEFTSGVIDSEDDTYVNILTTDKKEIQCVVNEYSYDKNIDEYVVKDMTDKFTFAGGGHYFDNTLSVTADKEKLGQYNIETKGAPDEEYEETLLEATDGTNALNTILCISIESEYYECDNAYGEGVICNGGNYTIEPNVVYYAVDKDPAKINLDRLDNFGYKTDRCEVKFENGTIIVEPEEGVDDCWFWANLECYVGNEYICDIYCDWYFEVLHKKFVVGEIESQEYNPNGVEPDFKVYDDTGEKELQPERDYVVEYRNNDKLGTAIATINGAENGGYTDYDTKYVTFEIIKKNVSEDPFKEIEDQEYTGTAIEPELILKDDASYSPADYTVTYSDNVDAGTATATATFKGNYTGEITKTFTITGKPLSSVTFNDIPNQIYIDGKIVYEPAVNIEFNGKKLVAGDDYTVSYENNEVSSAEETPKTATAKITAVPESNYSGEVSKEFKIINEVSIADCKITLSGTDYAYSGKGIYPGVSVTMEGITPEYSVAYKNNVAIGTATVVITGKGRFVGSTTKTFRINPPAVKLKKVSKGKKKITAKWAKVSKKKKSLVTGYQIRYSTNGAFSSNTPTKSKKGWKKTNVTVKKLAKKTRYYVQVRTYKVVGGQTYYSTWSNTKSAKTK